MNWPLLKLTDICLNLGSQEIFKNFNLEIYPGQHTALLGANGSGKSSLLRLMAARQWFAGNSVQVGQAVSAVASQGVSAEMSQAASVAKEMSQTASVAKEVSQTAPTGQIEWLGDFGLEAYLLQGRKLSALVCNADQEALTRQNLTISGYQFLAGGFTDSLYLQTPATEAQIIVIKELAQNLAASYLLDLPLNSLSVGQLRLLCIVRALLKQPKLLLLDEIYEGLDYKHIQILGQHLQHIATQATLVMTSHREDFPPFIQQKIHLNSPTTTQVAAYLPWQSSGLSINLQQAQVYVASNWVLRNLNWSLRPGETWAVVGANGSGKSTFLRLLAGDEFVAHGGSIEYSFQGKSLTTLAELRQHLCLVSDLQQATYTYDLNVLDLLVSGLHRTIGLYTDPTPAEYAQAWDMLHYLNLEFLAKRSMRSLSSGQLRYILLGRSLLCKPSVLLLDEPCSNLDAMNRKSFLDFLQQISQQGVQIIMSSHHPTDLLPESKVLRLEQGQIVKV